MHDVLRQLQNDAHQCAQSFSLFAGLWRSAPTEFVDLHLAPNTLRVTPFRKALLMRLVAYKGVSINMKGFIDMHDDPQFNSPPLCHVCSCIFRLCWVGWGASISTYCEESLNKGIGSRTLRAVKRGLREPTLK